MLAPRGIDEDKKMRALDCCDRIPRPDITHQGQWGRRLPGAWRIAPVQVRSSGQRARGGEHIVNQTVSVIMVLALQICLTA